MARDIWNEVAKIPARGQPGEYIRDGEYEYLIEKTELHEGENGTSFILGLYVTSSKQTDPKVEPNPVGSSVTSVSNLSKHIAAKASVKTFVLAALGASEGDIPEDQLADVMREIVSDAQPLRGVRIKNRTRRKVTEKNKVELIVNDFIHVPTSNNERAENRCQLDMGTVKTAESGTPGARPRSSALSFLKR